MKRLAVALTLVFASISSASAQGIGTALATIGGWTIYRSTDTMTDAPTCIATFGERRYVQLDTTSFAIDYRGRGGISGYRIRLNEDPPWALRLPTRTESDIAAFVMEGSDYQQIIAATRVRVQTLTVLSSVVNDDIDMTGVQGAGGILEILNGPQCVAPKPVVP